MIVKFTVRGSTAGALGRIAKERARTFFGEQTPGLGYIIVQAEESDRVRNTGGDIDVVIYYDAEAWMGPREELRQAMRDGKIIEVNP